MFKKLLALSLGLTSVAATANAAETVEFNETNFVALTSNVNTESVENLITQLEIRQNHPTYLYIRSGGGSILAGARLVEYLKTKKNVTVIVQLAASMAAVIAHAAPGKVLFTGTGVLMQHHAAGGDPGQNPSEIRIYAETMEILERMLDQVHAKRMGISIEEFRKLIGSKERWFGLEEAKKLNMADGEVIVSCAESIKDLKTRSGGEEVRLCPL